MYDYTDLYNSWLGLDPDSAGNNPFNNQFDLMGYNALFLIQNFGFMCWTIFLGPLAYIAAPIVVCICKGQFAYLKVKANRFMFFNYWIGFFNETFLFLAVCSGLNLWYFKFGTFGEAFNSLLALLFATVLIVYPIFVGVFFTLKKNFDRVKSKDTEFLARFGSVLSGLNIKRRGKLVLIHTCATMVRKLWLAHIVVF